MKNSLHCNSISFFEHYVTNSNFILIVFAFTLPVSVIYRIMCKISLFVLLLLQPQEWKFQKSSSECCKSKINH